MMKTAPAIVPPHEIAAEAFALASSILPPPILNHSLRVYFYARTLAEERQLPYAGDGKNHLLFTACIMHDSGCAAQFDGPQRFEVEGADAATALLRKSGTVNENDIHQVWTAIALHTSPGIAERISEFARLVREAVLIDFKKDKALRDIYGDEGARRLVSKIEDLYPRLEVEKILGDCVVDQAKRRPEKAPAPSWPGLLYRAALDNPTWEGVNKAF